MKEFFKNKLFIIILLFIILVTFISSNCFATSISYDEEVAELPAFFDNYYYFFYFNGSYDSSVGQYSYYICYYFSTTPITAYDVSSNGHYQFRGENGEFTGNGFSGSKWVTSETPFQDAVNSITEPTRFNDICWAPSSFPESSLILCNCDIYNDSNELVFQAPPQQVEEQETPQAIQQVTIPAIQQVEEIPQGMSQVLQVIIPIGLIILSIGLVVYLVRLVISRMK